MASWSDMLRANRSVTVRSRPARVVRDDLARLATTEHPELSRIVTSPLVGTPEDHLNPLVEGPRALEDLGQRRAGPPRVADQADLVRRGVAVAGTLQRERDDSTR